MYDAFFIQSAGLRCCRYLLEIMLRYTSISERQNRVVNCKSFLSSKREKKICFLLKLPVTAFKEAIYSKKLCDYIVKNLDFSIYSLFRKETLWQTNHNFFVPVSTCVPNLWQIFYVLSRISKESGGMDTIPLNRCQTSVIQTRRGGCRFLGAWSFNGFGGPLLEKK